LCPVVPKVCQPCALPFQVNCAWIWLGTAAQKSLASVARTTGCALTVPEL
jgi:hypothetical protein